MATPREEIAGITSHPVGLEFAQVDPESEPGQYSFCRTGSVVPQQKLRGRNIGLLPKEMNRAGKQGSFHESTPFVKRSEFIVV